MPQLKYLNLSHKHMWQLPVDDILFGSCHKLTTIDISDNQIAMIPQTVVADLVRPTQHKLELSNLSDNRLCILPTELLDNTQVMMKGNPMAQKQNQTVIRHMIGKRAAASDQVLTEQAAIRDRSIPAEEEQELMEVAAPLPPPHHVLTTTEEDISEDDHITQVENASFLLHSLQEITLRSIISTLSPSLTPLIPDHILHELK